MALSEERVRARLAKHAPGERPKTATTKHASVAAILRFRSAAAPEVLLIRRTSKPSDPWSGQIAFPGGRQDADDPDLVATAVRETREEVGLDLTADGELLGRLDDVQAISKSKPLDLIIAPHVFVLTGDMELTLQASEVAEAIWAPVAPMFRGEVDTVRPYEHRGKTIELPGYQVREHIVWGLTYRMLELLFHVARG